MRGVRGAAGKGRGTGIRLRCAAFSWVMVNLVAAAGVVATAFPAFAQTGSPACVKGMKSRAVAEMIFGRNIGEIEGAVGEEEWARFLDDVVTPKFPDGLTVIDAYGQWWNPPAGRVEREPTKMLLIVLTDEKAQSPKLAEVAAAYKRRFSQQSVMIMMRRACVTF